MHVLELINSLEEKGVRVFTINDLVRLSGRSQGYARVMAERLVSRGAIRRAARGVYYTNKATLLEVASNILSPSYVSLSSAFSYYGFIAQSLVVADVITPKRHSDATFESARIHFITLKKERVFGFYRDNANIFVAEPEKAFIDALYTGAPQYGYVEEAFEKAVNSNKLDEKKFLEYAERMKVKALAKKARAMVDGGMKGAEPERSKHRTESGRRRRMTEA